MTETVYPVSTTPILSAAEWSTMYKHLRGTGVLKGQLSGLLPFGDSSGMNTKVPPGQAWLLGHYYGNTTQVQLTISAAHATLGRIDRVVLRFTRDTGPAALTVLTGTANATPSLGMAALTQTATTWDIPLARVTVGAAVSTIAAGNVADDRQYSSPYMLSSTGGVSGTFTTSSASYVDLTDTVVTFWYGGGDVECKLMGTAFPNPGPQQVHLAVRVEDEAGTLVGSQTEVQVARMEQTNTFYPIGLVFPLAAVIGATLVANTKYTVKMRVLCLSGTASVNLSTNRRLSVTEVPL